MSGFEAIAAALGVADITLRSISSIYNLVKDQKQARKEITALGTEIHSLQNSLRKLEVLYTTDTTILATVKEFGLPEAVTACGNSCKTLEKHLPELTSSRATNCWAKAKFVFRKREIQSVLNDINTAKITTILTLQITTLHFQIKKPIAKRDKIRLINLTERRIARIEAMAGTRPQDITCELESETGDGSELARKEDIASEDLSYMHGATSTSYTETHTRKVKKETHNAIEAAKEKLDALKDVISSEVNNTNVTDDGEDNHVGVQMKTMPADKGVKSSVNGSTFNFGTNSKRGGAGVKVGGSVMKNNEEE